MICPSCHGEKQISVLVRGYLYQQPRCYPKMIACFTCRGEGEVGDSYPQRVEQGKELRAWRHDADWSLREMAKRFDMDVVALSQMERGIIPISDKVNELLGKLDSGL